MTLSPHGYGKFNPLIPPRLGWLQFLQVMNHEEVCHLKNRITGKKVHASIIHTPTIVAATLREMDMEHVSPGWAWNATDLSVCTRCGKAEEEIYSFDDGHDEYCDDCYSDWLFSIDNTGDYK